MLTKPPASLQHPSMQRQLQDGKCRVAAMDLCALPTVNNLDCKHGQSFVQCNHCKGKSASKMGTLWLLDLGALLHFMHDFNDFIEYETAKLADRMPVRTASDIVHIEGKGTVLIEHKVNNKLVQICLYPVHYIPKILTCLILMGQFLNDSLSVKGDACHISLYDKTRPMLTCKPISFSQNVYWLDTSVTDIQAKVSIFNTIYSADYNLLHRRLGHPSKDVLSNAKSKMKGFHQDLQIPTDMPVCPGCMQGKMPASSHPPSATRVKAAFECIHSDLKSFPVGSYHKYKYFVSFLDDFSLFAWVVLLQDKASAILALKQFLAMVRNQYNMTIKEWMLDAGREYKSEAFLKTLKDMGISIKQSAPHTPQQNGCAKHLMHTLMDKVQSMQLDACLPQSWWEFAVLHATHVYNRTPLWQTKWETPYTNLHGEAPNISHL
jgi:transposase InsO family protein